MAENQIECSMFEQMSVVKCLVTKKCKPWEIYRGMCDVYGEARFSQKKFTNGLNIGLPQQT